VRAGGMVVFFLKTASFAQKIIDEGYMFGDFFLNFKPFIYAPRVACGSCGSFDHKSCDTVICSFCAGSHDSSSCSKESPMKCKFCGESHESDKCPLYAERRKMAFDRKRQSYADILKKSASDNVSSRYGYLNSSGSSYANIAPVIPDSECVSIAGQLVPNVVLLEIIRAIIVVLKLDVSQQNVFLASAGLPLVPVSQTQAPPPVPEVIYVSSSPDEDEKVHDGSATPNQSSCDFDPAGELDRGDMDTSHSTVKRSRAEISGTPSTSCIAKCNCGKEFVRSSQIRNHCKAKKHCRADAKITCACGQQIMLLKNASNALTSLIDHLDSQCQG
jgi:hypothetical protein